MFRAVFIACSFLIFSTSLFSQQFPLYVPGEAVPKELLSFIKKECEKDKVFYQVVISIIHEESQWIQFNNYNKNVDGSIDIGLMQLNSNYYPSFIDNFGTKGKKYDIVNSSRDNAEIGIRLLKFLFNRYNSWFLATIAYNCGYNALDNRKVPLRTINYALRVAKDCGYDIEQVFHTCKDNIPNFLSIIISTELDIVSH